MAIKEKIEASPNAAGVYLFKDKQNSILYIGKAASIRKRLKSHFSKTPLPKQKALINKTKDIDYILTPDESTALLLESALIKRYNPHYNVDLKDDKSYPRLKLTVNEEFPRLFITRKLKDDGALYFGPYTNAKLLRKALTFMRMTFPLRTCQRMPKKECLNYHIGQCLAPCVGKSGKKEYLRVIDELKLFLDGKRDELLNLLNLQMKEASENKEYERAAKIRDRIRALSLVIEANVKNHTVLESKKVRFYPDQQVEELRTILKLPKTPHIIEAFDVSNIFGKEAVGSMVSFKEGKPDREEYRRFKIRTVKGIDDYSMMREIVSRRCRRILAEEKSLPDLIIIDGGKGHLSAVKKQLRQLRLLDLPVISIAKRLDKIYLSEDREPMLLGKFEATLLLLQRIRDEAHRFAIGYHRLLRRKEIGLSELDNIEGVGPRKKVSLMRHFGSLNEIKMADIEDLIKVEYVNEKQAKTIYDYFRGKSI
ncbi:MAG: excinuclease ABC subunit UvrC [Candidatus Omnitrophica bacterium]|nr:excinuclease ABC subunit UvrC [Candidatus Omnitrophota bacterium]